MQVRESIHHGDYTNERTIEVSDEVTDAEVMAILGTCPYKPPATARVAVSLALALRSGGSYGYGWISWEVVRPRSTEVRDRSRPPYRLVVESADGTTLPIAFPDRQGAVAMFGAKDFPKTFPLYVLVQLMRHQGGGEYAVIATRERDITATERWHDL